MEKKEIIISHEAGEKSYVAKVLGLDGEYDFKLKILACPRIDNVLAVDLTKIQIGNIIVFKIVKSGERMIDTKEQVWLVFGAPGESEELGEFARPMDVDEVKRSMSGTVVASAEATSVVVTKEQPEQEFRLTIDLVPKGAWYLSIAKIAKKTDVSYWRRLKDEIIKTEGEKCWICEKLKGRLDAHEFWDYDEIGRASCRERV